MNCFIYSIVIVISLPLVWLGIFSSDRSGENEKKVIAHSIIRNVKNELSKKYNMRPSSVSEATHRDDELYTEIGIGFDMRRPISKEEGRRILVESAEEFLSQINSHPEFRQYMHEYPFQANNIQMVFFISEAGGASLYSPDLALIHLSRGKVVFETRSRETGRYVEESVETWEEALKIVRSQERDELQL